MPEDQAPADKGGNANIEKRGLITDLAGQIVGGAASGVAAVAASKLSQSGQGDSDAGGQEKAPPAED